MTRYNQTTKRSVGASIQSRINSLRGSKAGAPIETAKPNLASAPRTHMEKPDSKTTGLKADVPEDEAFLRDFHSQIRAGRARKPSNRQQDVSSGAGGSQGSPIGFAGTIKPEIARLAQKARPTMPTSPRLATQPGRRTSPTHNGATRSFSRPGAAPSAALPNGDALPPDGSILYLATEQIVVLDRDVPGQCYQMVLVLDPDGSLAPQGINLRLGCDYRRIGKMPLEDIVNLHISQKWHRAQILLYLDHYEDSRLIPTTAQGHGAKITPASTRPEPENNQQTPPPPAAQTPNEIETASPAETTAVEEEEEEDGLTRGQHLKITFGKDRVWEAVYWQGKGAETVVAHKTHGDWQLMKLDITRFAEENIIIGEMMNEREVWELKEIIKRTYL